MDELKNIKPDTFKNLMRNKCVIDTRRIYDIEEFKSMNIRFPSIGVGHLQNQALNYQLIIPSRINNSDINNYKFIKLLNNMKKNLNTRLTYKETMRINITWFKRRWYDFRNGHSTYLAFLLAFTNFIVINYRLVVEKLPELHSFFPSLTIFALFFVITYIPMAIVIGYLHRTRQLKTEYKISFEANPIDAKLWRILLETLNGQIDRNELEEIIRYLKKIEKKE
ncbi:MAG: hypothetical protein NXY59_00540 [Aigarchaeota archaeon]|nr:hypothetical protein [Candidatus Pelearchaeum maunauluense]